jgi:hypothetical protein
MTDRRQHWKSVYRSKVPGGGMARIAPDALHAEFGASFRLRGHETEIHHTPAGKEQEFVYCYCVRA